MKHSTGPMNAEEKAYRDACVALGCVACHLRMKNGPRHPLFTGYCGPVEFHHLISGGIRVGHLWGVALGKWHHQARILEPLTHRLMRDGFGPSLAEGSKTFHRVFGSDAELLDFQDELLRRNGIEPPARPDNRRWSNAA